MTPNEFNQWLADMAISAAEAARLLGVHPNTITSFKTHGTSRMAELACAALFHRLVSPSPRYAPKPPEAVKTADKQPYGKAPGLEAALKQAREDNKKRGNKLKIAFDRTAYQRDYMRKRRAKQKDKP